MRCRLQLTVGVFLLAPVGCSSQERDFGASSSGAGGSRVAGSSSVTSGPGGDLPLDDMLLWLAADRGVEEEDGVVSRWDDGSGHDNDATQGIPAARPERVAGNAGALPALRFDGVNDALDLPPGFADFDAGLSFFAVSRLADDLSCPSILCLSNESEQEDICFGRNEGAPHYEVLEADVGGDPATFEPMQTVLMSVVHAPPDAAEIRLNGSFVKSAKMALPANQARKNNFVGRTLYAGCPLWKGEIAEILLYRRAVGEDERARIERYLQSRWSCCK